MKRFLNALRRYREKREVEEKNCPPTVRELRGGIFSFANNLGNQEPATDRVG